MRESFFLLLLMLFMSACFGQSISGTVINEVTNEPLCFASIGIMNSNSGTITNEKGFFTLYSKGFSPATRVRISMIGFEEQIFQLKELTAEGNIVRLKEQTVQLSEIIVRPKKTKRKTIGTKSTATKNVTGWGGCGNCGEDLGGIERGLLIDIDKPVFLENVNFHVAHFGFDSMLLRLHIRKIEKGIPTRELLNKNIYVRVKSAGWHQIDLTNYDLSFSQNLVVSLEWVKAWGKIKGQENSLKLSVGLFKGTLYAKDANEGPWTIQKKVSPGIYLTVEQE